MELQIIQKKIVEIRGQRVMLDFHSAELYAVETRVLVQAVKRNIKRFPFYVPNDYSRMEYFELITTKY